MNGWIAATGVFLAASAAAAECPPAEVMRARLAAVDVDLAARTARYGREAPEELYARAIEKPGRPAASREGQEVSGVIVVPLPAVDLWRAINDEPHHAEGFLPVDYSTVVRGRPRGADRVLFQYSQKMGIGRWWASRVRIGARAHAESEGKLWEIFWSDWTAKIDRTKPPVSDVVEQIRPIEFSEGAWMLVPLGERCTLVEEYSRVDPGGAIGPIYALVASGAIRDTLTGLAAMAREHRCRTPRGEGFLGPDGKPLDVARREEPVPHP